MFNYILIYYTFIYVLKYKFMRQGTSIVIDKRVFGPNITPHLFICELQNVRTAKQIWGIQSCLFNCLAHCTT
jgi:hypothetical protein